MSFDDAEYKNQVNKELIIILLHVICFSVA